MRTLFDAVGAWIHRPVGWRASLYPFSYMVILFYLSSIPDIPLSSAEPTMVGSLFRWVSPQVQNLLHIPLYALLALLWCRALRAWPLQTEVLLIAGFLISAIYGVFDEWHQSSTPGRFSSATDSALNALGAAIGAWLFVHFSRRSRTSQ